MKAKYLILVSLLLAIITIGAASASEDIVSDDALAAEDIAEDPIEEAPADDVIGDDEDEDPVDLRIYDTANIDDDDDLVVSISDDDGLNGTLEVYIGDNATPAYNNTFKEDAEYGYYHYSEWVTVEKLGLSDYQYGIYKVKAIYQKNGVATPYVVETNVDFSYLFSFYAYENDEDGSSEEFVYGDKIGFKVILPDNATNKVTIKFNGKSYDVTLKEGLGTVAITDELKLGEFTATATYLGDANYPTKTKAINITVTPFIDWDSMAVGEKSGITIIGPKGTTGSATLYNRIHDEITGEDKWGSAVKTVPIVDGQAIVPLENLAEGYHRFYLNYTIGNYKDYEYVSIDVYNNTPGYSSSVSANDIIVGNTVTVDISGPVSSDKLDIYLDGKFYKSATFATGKISEVISNLAVGQHKIKVYMDTGSKFYSNTFFVTVKQTPAPAKDKIKLTLKKVKTIKKSAKKLVLQATLKINGKAKKGLKIKFKFNKKTYTAKTNKKGVAKVTIKAKVLKKLKVGKKVKIQASYGKTVKKMTAKVKK